MTKLDALNKKLKLKNKEKLTSTPLGNLILEVFYGIYLQGASIRDGSLLVKNSS